MILSREISHSMQILDERAYMETPSSSTARPLPPPHVTLFFYGTISAHNFPHLTQGFTSVNTSNPRGSGLRGLITLQFERVESYSPRLEK